MKFTDENYKEMATAYENGETLAKLADTFGVSIPTMSKYVSKGGARVRARGQRKGSKKAVELAQVNNVHFEERTDEVAQAFVAAVAAQPATRVILPLE
jgi:predicted transcriptional regulator